MTPTQYKVFKKIDGPVTLVDGNGDEVEVEAFALLPDTFASHPIRAAAAKYGEGEYVADPLRSFERKTVTLDTTPRIKIG